MHTDSHNQPPRVTDDGETHQDDAETKRNRNGGRLLLLKKVVRVPTGRPAS